MQIGHIFLFNRVSKQKKHHILWLETKDVVILSFDKVKIQKNRYEKDFFIHNSGNGCFFLF